MKIVNGIYLPDRDIHFSEQILQNPIYEGKGTYQFPKLMAALTWCTSYNVAIDVGANIGLWTRILASRFDTVIAIEPLAENIECIKKNLEGFSNVNIVECAVNPVVGFLGLQFVKDVATSYVVSSEDADVEIQCRSLDSFNIQNVSFLKVDVEGYEHQVVQSGEKTIRTWKPTIVVEQKKKRLLKYGNDKHQPTVRLLESWGAREVWAKSGDHCLIWDT